MRKIVFLVISIIMINPVLALQGPSIGNCKLQGYEYNATGNLSTSDCIFNEDSKCNAEEFYNGSCGQEFVKDIPCGKLGESVHPQLQTCCGELEKFHFPGQKGGGDLCREPLGFFANILEKIKFFFLGTYF